MSQKNESVISYPGIQVAFMVATLAVFVLLLLKPLRDFKSEDEGPKVIPASQQDIERMKKEGRVVHTHLTIYDAPHIDFEQNTVNFKGYIIFTYDPKVIPLEVIQKFDVQKGTLKKLTPILKDLDNGMQSAHFAIDVTFSMYIDYTDYPLDDHQLSFAIVNGGTTPDKLLYLAQENDFFIEDTHAMARWKDIGHSVKTGHLSKPFEYGAVEYPALLFSIDYTHAAMRKTSIILLPLFLVFFLTTFGLTLNTKMHGTIIAITTTGISALMAYRYVIEAISPNVGYFMLSDYLFFLFFLTIFVNFILSLFIETISPKMLRNIIIGLYVWVLAASAYFLLIWL